MISDDKNKFFVCVIPKTSYNLDDWKPMEYLPHFLSKYWYFLTISIGTRLRTCFGKYSWCFQLFNFIHLLFRFVSFNFNFFVPFISLFLFCFLMLRFRKEEDEWDTDDSSLALIHSTRWLIKNEIYFLTSLACICAEKIQWK